MNRNDRIAWFKSLDKKVSNYEHTTEDLMLYLTLDEKSLKAMRAASANYLRACLGEGQNLSDDALLASINDAALPKLANRTPNGAVLPKKEVAKEFNELHRVVGNWVESLGLDDIVAEIFCPLTLRIMSGKGDPKLAARPYATSKMHADVWAGDPGDGVNVIVSLFGDVEKTAVDFYRPPADFEDRFLKHLADYDEGKEYLVGCEPYKFEPQVGTVLFFDAIVPHKTARKGGEARGTLQFNLRRKISAPDRLKIDSMCDKGKLQNFLPPSQWLSFGTSKYLQFEETLQDARAGNFTTQPYSKSFYKIVDRI
ncbi:MAG: hypothetical protein J0M12_00185 [Deltaproteobacteria bacterium]|nr:hypothetical protein [Deltaproteobacteria bacterium]